MKIVTRGFLIASLAIAVGFAVWALVSTILGDPGFSFLSALLLWLATGLPLAIAGLLLKAFRRRGSSMRMPAHYPDWARDQSDRP